MADPGSETSHGPNSGSEEADSGSQVASEDSDSEDSEMRYIDSDCSSDYEDEPTSPRASIWAVVRQTFQNEGRPYYSVKSETSIVHARTREEAKARAFREAQSCFRNCYTPSAPSIAISPVAEYCVFDMANGTTSKIRVVDIANTTRITMERVSLRGYSRRKRKASE